jgi:urease gamma subunit
MGKDIILTEKQLEKLVNGVKSGKIVENRKEGSYMAKRQLYTIAVLAMKMWEEMEDGEQLEDWMESKIAQAEQSVLSVVKTYMYDEVVDGSKGMSTLNYDEIIIGK